jgi:hypothetical protein
MQQVKYDALSFAEKNVIDSFGLVGVPWWKSPFTIGGVAIGAVAIGGLLFKQQQHQKEETEHEAATSSL